MKSVEQKRAREQRIVEQMISLYCRKNHKVTVIYLVARSERI